VAVCDVGGKYCHTKGIEKKRTFFFCSVLQLFEKVKKRNSYFYSTNAVK
jgi:hypothetical protein